MPPFITTARITCKSKAAREKVLGAFHKIIEFARTSEPGVTRYIAAVPKDDVSGTDLYMIEEYASLEANASHVASPPVQELILLFTSGDVLANSPEVHNTNIVAQKSARSPVIVASGPAIVLSKFSYKPGIVPKAVEGWKRVVDYIEKHEDGTLAYSVLATEGEDEVRTVEVYESWEYPRSLHLELRKDIRDVSKEEVRLRAVDGFFGDERREANL